jgi:hypothetical protein
MMVKFVFVPIQNAYSADTFGHIIPIPSQTDFALSS